MKKYRGWSFSSQVKSFLRILRKLKWILFLGIWVSLNLVSVDSENLFQTLIKWITLVIVVFNDWHNIVEAKYSLNSKLISWHKSVFFRLMLISFIVGYIFFVRYDSLILRVFNWDEANQMSIAHSLNFGKILFIDTWNHHVLGLSLLFQLFFKLFPTEVVANLIHGFNLLIIFVINWLIFKIFSKIKAHSYQLLAALFSLNFLYSFCWAKSAHGEFYVTFFVFIAFYLCFFCKFKRWKFFLSGALLTFAFIVKQVAIFDIGAFVIVFMLFFRKHNWTKVALGSRVLSLILGSISVFSLCMLYLYFNGVLVPGLFNLFVDPFLYAGRPLGDGGFATNAVISAESMFLGKFAIVRKLLGINWVMTGGLILGVGVGLFEKKRGFVSKEQRHLFWISLIWGTFVLFGLMLIGRNHSHYLIQLIVPCSFLFSFTFVYRSPLVLGIVILYFVFLSMTKNMPISLHALVQTEKSVQKLARYIQENSEERNSLYVESSNLLSLYYLSERFSPSTPFLPSQNQDPFVVQSWGTIISQLEKNPPRFIVVGLKSYKTKGLEPFLRKKYAKVFSPDLGHYGQVTLYRYVE